MAEEATIKSYKVTFHMNLMEADMTEKTTPYDPAGSLQSTEAIRIFLNDALLTEDVTYICDALQIAINAHNSSPR